MSDFCVCVTFTVAPGAASDFIGRVRGQAAASLNEPGCSVFEVWTDDGRPANVFLYEVYDSEAAFDEHLVTPHFREFDATTAGMVEAKDVLTWSRRG